MTTGSVEQGLRAAFDQADSDADGKLDLVGFTIILEGLGLTWSRSQTQARFEQADVDRDGLISFQELQDLLTTHDLA